MPVVKREIWLKMSPKEKLMHRIQRLIDHTHKLQADYDAMRVTGKIKEPIAFLEREG